MSISEVGLCNGVDFKQMHKWVINTEHELSNNLLVARSHHTYVVYFNPAWNVGGIYQ